MKRSPRPCWSLTIASTPVPYAEFVGGCSAAGNFVFPPTTFGVDGYPRPPAYTFRVFPVPGVYPFRNARNGARGEIIVGD